VDPLAVVVHGYGKLLLGGFLPDDVLIQEFLDFQRLGQFVGTRGGSFRAVVFQDGIADRYTFITDVRPWIIAG
jgi:hypothetical protein